MFRELANFWTKNLLDQRTLRTLRYRGLKLDANRSKQNLLNKQTFRTCSDIEDQNLTLMCLN
jgi:hypothetical protein